MSPFKVSFENMAWQQIRPDVRQKVYCEGSRQIRLVEFETSDGAQHWCETGHIGYVLKGALDISFDGNVISFKAGDGLFIPIGRGKQASLGANLVRHAAADDRGHLSEAGALSLS